MPKFSTQYINTTSFMVGAGVLSIVLATGFTYKAWNHRWTIDLDRAPIVDMATFKQTPGYTLGYDIYMPNSYTGWTPNTQNKLLFNNLTNTYELNNIAISGEQVDDWGARFKITSVDWQNEFGVTIADATNEQSKFGVPPDGAILRLAHYVDSRDMYFELPRNARANALNVKIKITSQDFHPTALLFIEYTSNE